MSPLKICDVCVRTAVILLSFTDHQSQLNYPITKMLHLYLVLVWPTIMLGSAELALTSSVQPCDCSLQWTIVDIDTEVGPFPVSVGQNGALAWPQCVRIKRCSGTCGRSIIENRMFDCIPDRRFYVSVGQTGQVITFVDQKWNVNVAERRVKLEAHSGCVCRRKLPDANKSRRRTCDFSGPFFH